MAQSTQRPPGGAERKRAPTDPDSHEDGLEDLNVTRPAPLDPQGISGERQRESSPGLADQNVTRPGPP